MVMGNDFAPDDFAIITAIEGIKPFGFSFLRGGSPVMIRPVFERALPG
jgi:hypothetical protein